jgi:hypothetical protein
MVTKGGKDEGRVAQVIDYSCNKSVYAIMMNYNGYVCFEKKEFLRKATQEEKNKDKKKHNKELQLDHPIRNWDDRGSIAFSWARLNLKLSGQPKSGTMIFW